ncbi:outer membrane beta-barrel family protein [soil metagenome]
MKKILSLLTALISLSFAQAQTIGNITGTVTDQQKPIESATVALLRSSDSAVIKKGATDNAGKFSLQYNESGEYMVSIQFVGFNTYYSERFTISENSAIYQVKSIVLAAVNQQLNNVVVVSKKPFIEQKLDKTIINVDASPTNSGLTALDVLEKSPGISIDKDGNVSLKGKQGVLILLDGKPTYLGGQDLANLLKNMPSANLDQIEIMTNPPAKYDAAGNSGVINIKTKKSKVKGFNGSVTVGGGIGIKPKANESVNLNYRTGKVNIFGNYSYSLNKNERQLDLTRNFVNQETGVLETVFKQQTIMNRNYQSHNYKIGMDYYATKKTTLGFVVNGYNNPGNWDNINTTNIYDGNNNLQNVTLSDANATEKWKNIGANLNFRHNFDTAGTELTGDFDYIRYSSDVNQLFNNYFFNETGGKTNPDEVLRGILPSDINIYSGKLDFTKTLKGDIKLEAGLKSSIVKTDNNAQYDNYINDEWQVDSGRTNHFIYKENINAAYVNLNKQLNKKWSVQTGLRLENTSSDGNQLTTGETFERNYTQLFPTAYLGYTMNEKNSFSLSYGRRIERPDYGDLNPFYYFLDKYTYQVGNPYLKPQFANNIELGHSFKGILNTTLSYNRTNNVMAEILEQVDSTFTSYVKQGNIAKNNTLGLSTNANFPVTKWWRTNIYAQVINSRYKGFVNNGDIDVSNTGFMTNISNQFQLKKGWNLELSGFYRSKMIEGTLVAQPMGVVNFAVAKNMLKNKGTIKVNLRDFLDIQEFRGYSKYQNVDVTIRNQWDNRVVNVSFTYRFSKGKNDGPQRRNSGAEDEQNRVKGGGN